MKAIICEKYGPPQVLKLVDVDKPTPKPHQILVKVMATAVNSADIRIRALDSHPIPQFVMRLVLGFIGPRNRILGVVLSGVVEAIGKDVKSFKPGDEVFAQTGFGMGCYAEYMVIAETCAIALKPKTATFEEAAAIPFGGSTALYFLKKTGIGKIPNQKVLIYGASGAVGTAAVQVAKHYGAKVTAVCGPDNVGLMKSLHADHVIVYTETDFVKNGEQYDIIFDAIGKKQKKQCVNSLLPHGQFVTVGGLDVASENKEQLTLLAQLFDTGEYKAVIDRTYPLEKMVEAHAYVDQWKKKGNVVITVSH